MKSHVEILKREKAYWEVRDDVSYLTTEAIDDIVSRLPPVEGDVLELCSGSGMFTRRMPETFESYTCLDLSARLLTRLKVRRPTVNTGVGNAEELTFKDEAFDRILMFAGLHHIPRRDLLVRACFQKLRTGGFFVCFEPNKNCWYRKPMLYLRDVLKIYTDDEVFLAPEEIDESVARAGFRSSQIAFLSPETVPNIRPTRLNRFLAKCMKTASRVKPAPSWQSWFLLAAQK